MTLVFKMTIGTFQQSARFVQRLRITDKASFSIAGDVRAQACNNESCTPPLPVDFSFGASQLPATVTVAEAATTTATTLSQLALTPAKVTSDSLDQLATVQGATTSATMDSDLLWTPVVEELQQLGMKGSTEGMSLIWIFLSGFIGGLIALVTPCVWPMIPMTVSFFLKRNKTEKRKPWVRH